MSIQENPAGVYLIQGFVPGVLAGFSGRQFPLVRRSDFLRSVGINPDSLNLVKQVHKADILTVQSNHKSLSECEADGLMTQASGVAIGVVTADCVPVFFVDTKNHAIGVAHAGWRGIHAGIVLKMLDLFSKNFRTIPAVLRIAFGPSIRACCYEVGDEFHGIFPQSYQPVKHGGRKGHMDLIDEIKRQFASRGILESQIFDTQLCTACHSDRFFSVRRDKNTSERILSVLSFMPESAV